MQDLKHLATRRDPNVDDTIANQVPRSVGAARALIQELPIVGKALAILIFGKAK